MLIRLKICNKGGELFNVKITGVLCWYSHSATRVFNVMIPWSVKKPGVALPGFLRLEVVVSAVGGLAHDTLHAHGACGAVVVSVGVKPDGGCLAEAILFDLTTGLSQIVVTRIVDWEKLPTCRRDP